MHIAKHREVTSVTSRENRCFIATLTFLHRDDTGCSPMQIVSLVLEACEKSAAENEVLLALRKHLLKI